MVVSRYSGVLTFLTLLMFAIANMNFAKSQVEIANSTTLENKTLLLDSIKVLVSYRPFMIRHPTQDNLQYRLFYNDVEYLSETATTQGSHIFLKDLDNNEIAEVIVRTYSGGAHCCTNFSVYTWQNSEFVKSRLESLDGSGGEFRDLDGDQVPEFITVNQDFLYKFSSYASSFPPSLILKFHQGEFKNVTHQYPEELARTASQMYKVLLTANSQKQGNVNGILAGYVAQKTMMGDYQEAWDFMLAHYDQDSDWGLDIYHQNEVVGQYPDFPTALKQFLIQQGYLDETGKPVTSDQLPLS
jgi:hypothetical protein